MLTGAGGVWSYATKPEALTLYKARWGNRESAVATIGVAPSISFRRIGPWFVVKTVRDASSPAARSRFSGSTRSASG